MMKSVYFKSGDAEWKYEVEDEDYDNIIKGVLEDGTDFDEMLEESFEILRDISALDDEEMDEDDQFDLTISVAFIWHYFNTLDDDEHRISGDVAVIENEDGTEVEIAAAADVIEG
jgi:hypothetical protein